MGLRVVAADPSSAQPTAEGGREEALLLVLRKTAGASLRRLLRRIIGATCVGLAASGTQESKNKQPLNCK